MGRHRCTQTTCFGQSSTDSDRSPQACSGPMALHDGGDRTYTACTQPHMQHGMRNMHHTMQDTHQQAGVNMRARPMQQYLLLSLPTLCWDRQMWRITYIPAGPGTAAHSKQCHRGWLRHWAAPAHTSINNNGNSTQQVHSCKLRIIHLVLSDVAGWSGANYMPGGQLCGVCGHMHVVGHARPQIPMLPVLGWRRSQGARKQN